MLMIIFSLIYMVCAVSWIVGFILFLAFSAFGNDKYAGTFGLFGIVGMIATFTLTPFFSIIQ